MKLSCHCGSINIEVANKPVSLTSCNCSICHRYGTLWGYYDSSDVAIDIGSSGITKYAWAEKSINFIHCKQCGCVTHYETAGDSEPSKTVVNFRMTTPDEIKDISIRRFDGADSWTFLD